MMRQNKFNLLGRKIGMTTYIDNKLIRPATLIQLYDHILLKYNNKNQRALMLVKNKNKLKKPQMSILSNKYNIQATHGQLIEIFLPSVLNIKLSSCVTEGFLKQLDKFNEETIDLVGISKGKGFSGVMKIFNFSGGPASHGSSKFHRKGGSLSGVHSKIWKGKKMPRKHGNKKTYHFNIKVLEWYKEKKQILVLGGVAGNKYRNIECIFKERNVVNIKCILKDKIYIKPYDEQRD